MNDEEVQVARALKDNPEFNTALNAAKKNFENLKSDLFSPIMKDWRGPHRRWMDAALVVNDMGKPEFPGLLGTGGNDCRLDFTNNAMQRIVELLDIENNNPATSKTSHNILKAALWGENTHHISRASIGQFYPGMAGGFNSNTGSNGESLANSWDFLLMLEGAIVLQSRSTRRLGSSTQAKACAPFAMHAHATGFSSNGLDEGRGEQWLPLWNTPSTIQELNTLFGEARLQIGKQNADQPLDAARAIARLGIARGICRFTRYGYMKRNADNHYAVPLGQISVRCHPHSRLIDNLTPWLNQLNRASKHKNAPNHLIHAERKLADTVFAALTHNHQPRRWQAILIAAAEVETLQQKGSAIAAGPMPPLNTQWLQACDDDSVEWRLALSLGSAAGHYQGNTPQSPLRDHWLPLASPWKFDTVDNGKKLATKNEIVMMGRNLVDDCIAILERRLIDATKAGSRRLPLVSAYRLAAQPSDLAAFIQGEVDDQRILGLLPAIMAVTWQQWDQQNSTHARAQTCNHELDATWWALRLASLPWPLESGHSIPCDPAMIRRCASGDASSAVTLAVRRLRAHGIHPAFSGGHVNHTLARRWAAALAFPITRRTAEKAAANIDPTYNNRSFTSAESIPQGVSP